MQHSHLKQCNIEPECGEKGPGSHSRSFWLTREMLARDLNTCLNYFITKKYTCVLCSLCSVAHTITHTVRQDDRAVPEASPSDPSPQVFHQHMPHPQQVTTTSNQFQNHYYRCGKLFVKLGDGEVAGGNNVYTGGHLILVMSVCTRFMTK